VYKSLAVGFLTIGYTVTLLVAVNAAYHDAEAHVRLGQACSIAIDNATTARDSAEVGRVCP
jgi:hypothetical protein